MAMIFFQPRLEGTLAEIHTVIVDEKDRGQGIGDLLTEAMVAQAKKVARKNAENISLYLTSKPAREPANKLYQKHGFELVAAATGDKGTNLYKLVITP
jgi:ribosomal protein S18 acetylase RimI-like enzyme